MNKINPIAYFTNPADGRPLSGGKLYFGKPGTDPAVVSNQKTVYALQENGNYVAIPQPVALSVGGTPVYNGANVSLYISGDYSLKALTSTNVQKFYIPDSSVDLSSEQGVYDTVADMVAANPTVGALYKTKGYDAIGDGGGATYLIKTSAQFGGTPDEKADHTVNTNDVAAIQITSVPNVKMFGAIGNSIADDTASFTSAASKSKVVRVPYTSSSYLVNNSIVNSASTFIFEGDSTQISGTATEDQLNAVFIDEGKIEANFLGVPYSDLLKSSKIGIVAGAIRQNSTTRTQWDYISDSNHVPVGVSGSYATASGGTITIPFDKTYSRVLSFIAAPDETLSNAMGVTLGASVGLSSAVVSAAAVFNGSFIVYWNGSSWVFSSGTGQNINPVLSSYSNGSLTINHDYCRGIAADIQPYSLNGSITNPYIPIIKTVGNSSITLQWLDTSTGNVVVGAASTRMLAVVTKVNNLGLYLDGTNDSDVINGVDMSTGNIWFLGVFEE